MIKVVGLTAEQEQRLFGSSNTTNASSDSGRSPTTHLIQEWLRQDRCPSTRKEVETWQNLEMVDHWLHPRISFGTAGLRAQVGAGYARMNNLVVLQTSQGLARWVFRQSKPPGISKHTIVIGYDGRFNSREFAELAASAILHADVEVIWLGKLVHTPLVAFTVKEKQASAGIMITASHNPKEDNGYKVYASNGCQINTPIDEEIQSCIIEDLEVPADLWDTSRVDGLEKVGDHMQKLYVEALISSIGPIASPPRFVYTPLHGTGLEIFTRVLNSITVGTEIFSPHRCFYTVTEQAEPDPSFPTLKFPNPEEQGALLLAQSLAEKQGISLIIANDPDADRLAVSERSSDGTWYQLKGDEVGTLLGWYLFREYRHHKTIKPKMLTSAVSSSFLATIGSLESFSVDETLTGFKWIGNVALAAEKAGEKILFGYEEALGYMIPGICHDKDGVSAAMLFLQATAYWKGEYNQTPLQVLRSLYQKYGWIETANTYFKSPSLELTGNIFRTIQAQPGKILDVLPADTEIRVRDALTGTDSGEADGKSRLPQVKGNLMITIWLTGSSKIGDTARVTIRASGTEPKVKIYVECKSKQGKDTARNGAAEILRAVAKTWFQDKRFTIEERWKHIAS